MRMSRLLNNFMNSAHKQYAVIITLMCTCSASLGLWLTLCTCAASFMSSPVIYSRALLTPSIKHVQHPHRQLCTCNTHTVSYERALLTPSVMHVHYLHRPRVHRFNNELAPQLSSRLADFTSRMPDLIPAVLQVSM